MPLETFSYFVGAGVAVLQIVLVLGILGYFFSRDVKAQITALSARTLVWGGFFLASGAIVMSLIFQYAYLLTVCPLCWYQRIFMYPLAVLFGLALYRKEEEGIAPYALALSVVGMFIALYHSFLQYYTLIVGSEPGIPCGATINEVSCAEVSWVQFDYLTFPVIAVTVFAVFIALILLVQKKVTK